VPGGTPEGVDYFLYINAKADGSSMTFAEQFAGRGSRLTGEFLNRFQVEGVAFDGYPLRMQVQDSPSISGYDDDGTPNYSITRYVGWRKTDTFNIQDDPQRRIHSRAKLGESTWDLLGQSLIEHKDTFGERGLTVGGVPIPLNTGIRPGMVGQCVGGNWNRADGKKFRTLGAQHATDGRTTLTLREMVGPED
jgi:hypothetical protein